MLFLDKTGVKWKSLSRVRLFATPWTTYSPWDSPGQNTGVGSLSLLPGIFPTQGQKPRSPTLQAGSLPAEPQGKPGIGITMQYGCKLQELSTWGKQEWPDNMERLKH